MASGWDKLDGSKETKLKFEFFLLFIKSRLSKFQEKCCFLPFDKSFIIS